MSPLRVRRLAARLLLPSLPLALSGAVSAQTFHQRAELFASNGSGGGFIGDSIAVDGDTLVAGAHFEDYSRGSAYVFVRSGTTWIQQARLVAGDGAYGDEFGHSVAISGDTVVIGASRDEHGADFLAGSAYVFVRSGTAWVEQAKLVAGDTDAEDRLGISVAIQEDTVVVGAHYKAIGTEFEGSVYVFERAGTAWTERAHLLPSDYSTRSSYGFGACLSLHGDTLVVGESGAPFFPGTSAAYVFVRSGSSWSEQARLDAPEPQLADFGGRVSLDGDTIAISAKSLSGEEAVHVFVRQGTSWAHEARLQPLDWERGDGLWHVSLSGDRLAVGARFERHLPGGQGAVYLFERTGGAWALESKLVAADSSGGDAFGCAVDFSGATLAIGASGNHSAYVFEPSPGPGPRLSSVTPATFEALVPGTAQFLSLRGADLDLVTALLVDGTPIDPTRYTIFGPDLITLDVPQVDVFGYGSAVGRQLLLHGLRAVGAQNSDDVQFLAVVPPAPLYEVGSGDPLNVVHRDDGLDLVLAGTPSARHALFVSASDRPSSNRWMTLEIGNGFTQLAYVGTYVIPTSGWLRVHVPPSRLGNPGPSGCTVYSQSVDLDFPAPLDASNLQSVQIVP